MSLGNRLSCPVLRPLRTPPTKNRTTKNATRTPAAMTIQDSGPSDSGSDERNHLLTWAPDCANIVMVVQRDYAPTGARRKRKS
jgi:hypothetical protein